MDNFNYKEFETRINKEDFIELYPTIKHELWFSDLEMEKFPFPQSASSLAGRYLIKKAIADFLHENDLMHEVEILNNEMGKPEIRIGSLVSKRIKEAGISEIHCSISHSRKYITGLTVISF